jgi:hypothetical protein
LYELLMGAPAFSRDTLDSIISAIVDEELFMPVHFGGATDEALHTVS